MNDEEQSDEGLNLHDDRNTVESLGNDLTNSMHRVLALLVIALSLLGVVQ